MMMRIDKSWSNNFVLAIDDGNIFGRVNILANLGDTAIGDQDIGVSENNDIIVLIMLKDSAILEK